MRKRARHGALSNKLTKENPVSDVQCIEKEISDPSHSKNTIFCNRFSEKVACVANPHPQLCRPYTKRGHAFFFAAKKRGEGGGQKTEPKGRKLCLLHWLHLVRGGGVETREYYPHSIPYTRETKHRFKLNVVSPL